MWRRGRCGVGRKNRVSLRRGERLCKHEDGVIFVKPSIGGMEAYRFADHPVRDHAGSSADRSQARSVHRGKSCAKPAGVHSSGCKISSVHARRTLRNDQGKMRTRIHFGRAQQGPHRSPCSAPCPSSPLHSWGLACTAFTNGSDSTNALRRFAHSHTGLRRETDVSVLRSVRVSRRLCCHLVPGLRCLAVAQLSLVARN